MKKIIILLFITLSLGSLFAKEVTINDAIEGTRLNSISLAIAKEQLEQSLRSASVLSSYLPNISLTGTATTTGSAITGTFTSLSVNVNAGITWSIGTSLIGKKESAAIQRTLAELTYSSSAQSVESAAVSSYLSLARTLVNNLICR
ncbi:TolC family protein [Bullifex porci]|uniref:TolC family protein n=1 Tax=Bullifex porci TaxID=2606638 RepID=UPI0023F0F174|nr:TolC family protein [Bullifex porci]MDD7254688.1 TolC family protein [Bullifex porci]MDY2740344.1 TolC family protein [Bullifex porci]